ncbi:hypothetical protein, partial [Peribacillus sp. NPDC096540]|uniref:hypothetical protein n=1 Tax=Peribacillus sp. NPDC096540 TaxID=3390612 RepID=UPI003D041C0C
KLNRRIPNGMYGGVRGRRLGASSYSILCNYRGRLVEEEVEFFLVISSRAKKIIEQIIAGIEKPGSIKYVPNPNPI